MCDLCCNLHYCLNNTSPPPLFLYLSHRPQLGLTNTVFERDYLHGAWQGGLGLLRPEWLWHLFNAEPCVFTLPDKSPVCRPGLRQPLACADSTATHSLTGLAPMSNGCQKMLIFQTLFSSPRGKHSSSGNTLWLHKTSHEIMDCWSLLITEEEGGIQD